MEYTLEELNKMMDGNYGNLDLNFNDTKEISLPISLPKGLTARGWLDLAHTEIESLPEGLTVRGTLYLRYTPIIELPEGLTVGRTLDLEGTPIKSLPKGLTVGGDLNLKYTKIKSLPRDLKVGGKIYSDLPKNELNYTKLQQGEYVENSYLYADEIFTLVKSKKSFDKYTYFIGEFKGQNVLYDGTYYAHCENIKKGLRDLNFKHSQDRRIEQYKNLKLTSNLSFDESKTMYRILTGACRQGTESFISNLKTIKDQYTIQELIDLTVNQYGHEVFKKFFK